MAIQNQLNEFFIGKTKIGGTSPCFIVAEIGINFNGKYKDAVSLIDVATKAGCNAVKFQFFTAKKMYVENAGDYIKTNGRKGDIFELIKKAELPENWIPRLKKYAGARGLEFFLTVCDEEGADILEKFSISAYKIASYEITHVPLLRHVARKGRPVIFSSAGSTVEEIERGLKILKEEGNNEIVLLHCIGKYPAPLKELNLNIISNLKKRFPKIVIGYSDHSLDPIIAPCAAVILGAKLIEKHITLDRNLPGNDNYCAIEPDELFSMVRAIRKIEEKIKNGIKVEINPLVLGSFKRKTYKGEEYVRNFAYRCVFAVKKIKKGTFFSKDNIAVLRPGNAERGLEPKYYELLVGRYKSSRTIEKGEPIKKGYYEK